MNGYKLSKKTIWIIYFFKSWSDCLDKVYREEKLPHWIRLSKDWELKEMIEVVSYVIIFVFRLFLSQ